MDGPFAPGVVSSPCDTQQAALPQAFTITFLQMVPGSRPGGSRVIRRWGRSRRLWKYTYLIPDIKRLEMDCVVGRLLEKKRLNNLDYVE